MYLASGILIPNTLPALYLEGCRTLVISDLHIGQESVLRLKGVHIPEISYPRIKEDISALLDKTRAEEIVLLGDVKHELGRPSAQEWVEVKDLLGFLADQRLGVHIVRGNHDNYILSILGRFSLHLHDPCMQIGDALLIHGDKKVLVPSSVKTIIMGHEHPAVSSRDSSGSRYKFRAFLVGKYDGREIIVMPASSPLAAGVGINEVPRESLLSPILKEADIDSFEPIVVERGVGVFRFPQIGLMRSPGPLPARGL